MVESLRFQTVVADPPWELTRTDGGCGLGENKNHRPLEYPTMTIAEIAALDVEDIVYDTCFCFIWTVNKYVEATYAIARAWGFRPVTLLTWCKKPKGKGLGGQFGSTTEFILYSRRGSSEMGRRRIHPSTWFEWERGAHSVKPEAFQDLVEAKFPGPRLELFARRPRDGWSVWGNEVDCDINLSRKVIQTP
jgi:N6-adenosine-specific RNA methylase IME4